MSPHPTNQQPQTHVIKPKIGGFLFSYILFSLPGFVTGLIWLIISVVILGGVLIGFNSNNSNLDSSSALDMVTLRQGKSKDGVLIYEMNGPITSGNFSDNPSGIEINTNQVAKDFKKIKENPNIKNVIYKYNTPGGELYASEILGDLISDLQNSKAMPRPNFYFDQLAASGGLWSSYKTGGYVYGSPYGETGSIGVIMSLPNYKGIADKIGYSETVIKSSNSKDIGNPFREVTPQEKEYFQKQLDQYFNRFKTIVARGRNLSPEQVEVLATGLTFPNNEAVQNGLIDEVANVDKAIQSSARQANLGDDFTIYKSEKKSGIFGKLFQGQVFKNILGLPQIDAGFKLLPGHLYAVDETKI